LFCQNGSKPFQRREVNEMATMLDLVPVSFRSSWPLSERFFGDWEYPFYYAGEYGDWVPASDIAETPKEYVLTMELPGIDMKKTDITFSDGILSIRGEKVKDSREGECCHCAERYSGSFERSFRISNGVDKEKIDASYKDGILTVTLPKTEESSVKKIEIH
jgi:HSP20 family protein